MTINNSVKVVSGTVKKVEKRAFTSQFGDLIGNKITIESKTGDIVVVEKNTKPDTNFNPPSGTEVTVQYTTEKRNGFNTNKVVKDDKNTGVIGFAVHSGGDNQAQPAKPLFVAPKEQTLVSIPMDQPALRNLRNFDPDGARKGMLFNNAVQAALKLTPTEKMKVSDVIHTFFAVTEDILIGLTELSKRQDEGTLGSTSPVVQAKVKTAKKAEPVVANDAPWDEEDEADFS